MHTFGDGRPLIQYPCTWSYRIICTDETLLRSSIPAIVGAGVEHTVADVGASSSGRFQRLELRVEVRDQPHRDGIFQALGALEFVRFVL